MLELVLEKARERGLDRVLITCAKTNIASVRLILKNGGVLDSESYSDRAGRVTQRYWIELRDAES
jgi:predicted acetyltransferase